MISRGLRPRHPLSVKGAAPGMMQSSRWGLNGQCQQNCLAGVSSCLCLVWEPNWLPGSCSKPKQMAGDCVSLLSALTLFHLGNGARCGSTSALAPEKSLPLFCSVPLLFLQHPTNLLLHVRGRTPSSSTTPHSDLVQVPSSLSASLSPSEMKTTMSALRVKFNIIT